MSPKNGVQFTTALSTHAPETGKLVFICLCESGAIESYLSALFYVLSFPLHTSAKSFKLHINIIDAHFFNLFRYTHVEDGTHHCSLVIC